MSRRTRILAYLDQFSSQYNFSPEPRLFQCVTTFIRRLQCDPLRSGLITQLFRWKATALSITSNKNVRFETGLYLHRILQSILSFVINGFTKAAFVDPGKTQRDNDLSLIFVIWLIRTSRYPLISHVSKGQLHPLYILAK